MPLSFVIIGLIIIYIIYYLDRIPHRKILTGLLISMLVGYFIGDIDVMNGVIINPFILFPVFIIDIYLLVSLNRLQGILLFISAIVSTGIYILFVSLDIEYSTLIDSDIAFLIATAFTLIFSFDVRVGVAYAISSFLLFDMFNIVLIKNYTGVVSILSVSSLSSMVYLILIAVVSNRFYQIIKNKLKKEKV